MYSTARNQTLPQYVDYPTSLSRPRYQAYPQNHQATHVRSARSISDEGMPLRATNTQDLATFLRESSPKDFQKYLTRNAPEEQPSSFGSSYKKSLKFLRPASSKTKHKQQPTLLLPSAVSLQKTIRGKPYLQIHVNYDTATCYQTHQIQSAEASNHRFSTYGISEFSSDFASRDSRPPSGSEDRPALSPAPWGSSDSMKTLETETANTYQQYLNVGQDPDAFTSEPEAKIGSPSIEAVGGSSLTMSEYGRELSYTTQAPISSKRHSDPHSYASSQQNTISAKTQRRSSSARRTSKGSYSPRSSVYSTGDELADADSLQPVRRNSRRVPPPRPGPPPARCLPALPETHDCTTVPTAADSVAHRSQISTSTSVRSGASGGNTCNRRTVDEAIAMQREHTTRQQRVKARRSRDMQQVRLLQQASRTQETMNALSSSGGVVGLQIITSGRPIYSNGLSSGSKITTQSGKQRAQRTRGPKAAPKPPKSSEPHLEVRRKSPLSSAMSSSKSFLSQYDVDSDMESRIQAVERKNRMLEKMLIAVIRGTVGQDHRQAELQRANSLDDLLQQLKLVDAGTSSPMVSAKSA